MELIILQCAVCVLSVAFVALAFDVAFTIELDETIF